MSDFWLKIMFFELYDFRNFLNRQWYFLFVKSFLCSERFFRFDLYIYQFYIVGLLYFSGKFEKFFNFQKYYSVLERILEFEKKRSKSLRLEKKLRSWYVDIIVEDEELEDFYFELDEVKKNKEFFSRKSEYVYKYWNLNVDKGLM